MRFKLYIYLVLLALLASCTMRPELSSETAMRATDKEILLQDDFPFEPLIAGIEQNIERLLKVKKTTLRFGDRVVDKQDYILSLRHLSRLLKEKKREQALKEISQDFDFFEVYGDNEWGEVFVTSYFDPVIEGKAKPQGRFTQPLYAVPRDLVSIRMGEFLEVFPRLRSKIDEPNEQKSDIPLVRGRLVSNGTSTQQVVPFFSRKEIDTEGKLKGRGLEIVWVDPIKAFSMQIQGSGLVRMPNGKLLRLGYAAQNGHKYVPIGRYLLDVIPIEKMSMGAIEAHLRSIGPQKAQEILNLNPSYVFFRKLDTKSITYFGTEVVEGRTIATDYRYFPKGALGFLKIETPEFDGKGMEPVAWQPTSRLVIDQDTGGAIRGGGRLDLYWGKGAEAERSAGVMRRHGRLYYLAPSEELLQRLRTETALSLR